MNRSKETLGPMVAHTTVNREKGSGNNDNSFSIPLNNSKTLGSGNKPQTKQ